MLVPIRAIVGEFCDVENTVDEVVNEVYQLLEAPVAGIHIKIRQLLDQLDEAGFLFLS